MILICIKKYIETYDDNMVLKGKYDKELKTTEYSFLCQGDFVIIEIMIQVLILKKKKINIMRNLVLAVSIIQMLLDLH